VKPRRQAKTSPWPLVPEVQGTVESGGRMVGIASAHAADVPAVGVEAAEVVVKGSDRAAFARPDFGNGNRW
jgi:hypothetical protein